MIAPEIHTTESPASWILRICRMHAVNYPTLMKAFGLPCYADPDVALDGPTLCRIGAGTAVARNETLRLGSIFRSIRACPSLGVLLHRDESGTPAYKFCDHCLSCDKHPYLRLEWRIAGLNTCLIHRVRLKSRCWSCSATLQSTRTRLSSLGDGRTLANCTKCLVHLPDSRVADEDGEELQDSDISFQKSLVAAVLRGYFYVTGCDMQLPLGFLAWLLETGQYRPMAQPQISGELEPPLVAAAVRGLYSSYIDRSLRRAWFAETAEFS
ncbi:TniQ family protein [Paraburkholderia fungorum]|uniref:TniQ family protein n=1 Tax=Paraburkholderia fungorum TaxID=134537 RepID=UPI0038BBF032